MKRLRLMLWLAVMGGVGLVLFLLPTVAGHAALTLAAPRPARRLYTAQITCTLSTTTTDSLPGINSFGNAAILADYYGLALASGNLGDDVVSEEDYFRLDNAIPGHTYDVRAVPDGLGNYNLGIVVYDAGYTPVLTDSNTLDNNEASVALVAENTGPYYFKVYQISSSCSGGTYYLDAYDISPTNTPTSTAMPTPGPSPTPSNTPSGPTPIPGADQFEPNYDFDHAATIGTDVTYSGLNFIPWGGGEEDNDFYKLWVKPGIFFTCETSDLDPGVDPNMIFYDNNRNPVASNDDADLVDWSNYLSYYSTYEGYLYVLIGHGGRLSLADVEQSGYSLRCSKSAPGMPTLTPKLLPTSTPRPSGTATSTPSSPLPTPTPSGELSVRTLATPSAPSASTPTIRFVPIDLLVYYDANDDHSPGAGEGIGGILARAYDTVSGEQVAEGFTDGLGHLQFTTAAQGAVRLDIPYLGVSQLVGSDGASVYVRVAPQPLPDAIP